MKAKCVKCPTSPHPQNSLVTSGGPPNPSVPILMKNHSEIHTEKRGKCREINSKKTYKKEPSEPTQGPTYLGGGKKANYEFRCEILEGQNLSHEFHCDFCEKTKCEISHTNPGLQPHIASLAIIVPTRSPFFEISKSQKSEHDTARVLSRPH